MLISEQFCFTKFGDRNNDHVFLADVEIDTDAQAYELINLWLVHRRRKRRIIFIGDQTDQHLVDYINRRVEESVTDFFYESYNDDEEEED